MKIIDRLLLRSFMPPFAVTFMIATFVLLIQILWVYIDDLAGKGLSIFLIVELLAYKCVSLVPMALPLALLISSVMVLGNLAEHYELSSLKSAGISLPRVMAPMLAFGMLSMGVSYYCSDYLIPVSNLKFGSRMYDIQRQKPALRLEEGVFNDDFQGFSIRIGDKKPDGQGIADVLIYDHKSAEEGSYNHINARSGRMYTLSDQKRFVMKLEDGHQYVEPSSTNRGGASYPFIRTNFRTWTRVFDLTEFDLQRTNEELFKNNRSMLSIAQLQESIDSMGVQIAEREKAAYEQLKGYIPLPAEDTLARSESVTVRDTLGPQLYADSSMEAGVPKAVADAIRQSPEAGGGQWKEAMTNSTIQEALLQAGEQQEPAGMQVQTLDAYRQQVGMVQVLDKPLREYGSLLETFGENDQRLLLQSAQNLANNMLGQAESNAGLIVRMKKNRVKFIYDLHMKYSFAVMCVVFLFIGAPMGAIVRKGGFGFPILIATIFFVTFIILTIFCRKIAEAFVVSAQLAAWIPALLFMPLGAYLTMKAMNDAELLKFEALRALMRRLRPVKSTV